MCRSGNFEVDVSTQAAYFAYVEALKSIRGNADVSALCIIAQKDYGCVWDVHWVLLAADN